MLPPPSVLTNKKCRPRLAVLLLALVASVGLTGCGPPGPRALLDGEKLLKEGRPAPAVERLQKAARLMPKDARAWNFLGLAHHGNQQPDEAIRAYQTAISLDRNLAAARYNLGCLYLEQNNLNAAATELYTYALLQPTSVDGLLKLGAAHLRAKRLREAETCFKSALELHPRHAEALNNLGVIQMQKRNFQEANNFFNLVRTQHPDYAPALLNFAVVNHQALNNRRGALEAYRKYLAANPPGADRMGIEAIVQQLDSELNPAPLVLHPVTPPPARTATVAAITAPVRIPTNQPVASVPSRTNPAAVAPVKPAVPPTNPVVVARHTPPPVVPPPRLLTNVTPSAPPNVPPSIPPNVPEIPATTVTDNFVVKPAQEIVVVPTANPVVLPTRPPPAGDSVTTEVVKPKPEAPKRGFIARLNPFSRKPKEADPKKPEKTAPGKSNLLAGAGPTTLPPAPVEQPPPPPIPRYPFQKPAAPGPGVRAQAEPPFQRGLKAHKAGNRKVAIDEYQNALRADPSWYDAYYNLGLAAQDTGQLGLSLIAYETALALKPESADARYNFALALKAGSYTQDAADQLTQLLHHSPGEVRAHLSLANICAQQLRQPAAAREHYLKVLELKPDHPEAARIRAWLDSNP